MNNKLSIEQNIKQTVSTVLPQTKVAAQTGKIARKLGAGKTDPVKLYGSKIRQMIKKEDAQKPYSDMEVAKKLSISRNIVTSVRVALEIASPAVRKKGI